MITTIQFKNPLKVNVVKWNCAEPSEGVELHNPSTEHESFKITQTFVNGKNPYMSVVIPKSQIDDLITALRDIQGNNEPVYHPVMTISREDIEWLGYDTSKVDEDDIADIAETAAENLNSYIRENFMDSLRDILEVEYDIPLKE